MKIRGYIDTVFQDYKKISSMICAPYCDWKCCKECGEDICQNLPLVQQPIMDIDNKILIDRYIQNKLSSALIIAGLEPFDNFEDLLNFIKDFRQESQDEIIIFTGFYEYEIAEQLERLKKYSKIIVKFGRFIPNQESHYDEVLGVNLANKEQYAIRIS